MLRTPAIVAALVLALTGTAVASSTGDCYSQEGCTQDARSAEDLVASVGVNTHLGYSQTVYWQNWPMVRDRLVELGVSHIRDGTFPAEYPEVIGPTIAARYNELNAAGIKGNLLVGIEQAMAGKTTVAQRLDWIKANVPSFTTSIEGSNEFHTWGGDPARIQSLRDMQCDIHGRVKNDPALASKPVVGPSAGHPWSDDIWYGEIGDLSACLDRGNLHPYPGEDPPHRRLSRELSAAMEWGQRTYGAKPYWATESGYWTKSPDGSHVSEQAAGVYIPRLLMEYFRRGIERTQAYELIDLNPGSSAVLDNYGLLRNDGTRKPAFTALRNMLRIVDDTAPAAGQLRFGIVCTANCRYGDPDTYPTADGPIRHVLLKHSTGAYYLAVWSESSVWDPASRTDTPKTAQSFRLSLHKPPAKVEIFSPSAGTAPLSTDTSGRKTISAVATDGVRLIKITPSRATAPSAAATTVQAGAASPDSAGSAGNAVPPATPWAASRTACSRPKGVKRIAFSKAKYPNVRAHHVRAVRRGWPRVLVVNRKGVERRRAKLAKNIFAIDGLDRNEYPPAIGRGRGSGGLRRGINPIGWRADVEYVPERESRSHDSTMQSSLKRLCSGTRFRYVFR